jgi:hypothetical protein
MFVEIGDDAREHWEEFPCLNIRAFVAANLGWEMLWHPHNDNTDSCQMTGCTHSAASWHYVRNGSRAMDTRPVAAVRDLFTGRPEVGQLYGPTWLGMADPGGTHTAQPHIHIGLYRGMFLPVGEAPPPKPKQSESEMVRVELKANQGIEIPFEVGDFDEAGLWIRKRCKMQLTAVAAGVAHVVLGFRNDQGAIVRAAKTGASAGQTVGIDTEGRALEVWEQIDKPNVGRGRIELTADAPCVVTIDFTRDRLN